MRHNTCWGRCTTLLIVAAGFLGAMYMGCGSSGSGTSTSSSSGSGVAVSGTANVPSDASASESAPLSKSVSKAASDELSADVASLSKDTAVGAGKTVTCTDAKSGEVLGTTKTDSAGAYSVNIPTTATDVIISVKVNDETEINRLYTAAGVAATGVTVDADTSAATVAVLQKCQEVIGVTTDIDISELPTKCGASITAGTLIPDAIYAPYLAVMQSGVAAGSADASSGKGCAGAQGLMFRELLSNKLKGTAGDLKGQDPYDVLRKAYLTADSAALANVSKYAPTISASVTPSAAFSFAKDSLVKSIAAVTNDSATYTKFKRDPTVIGKFFENVDVTSAAKFVANPDDLQFQIKDSFDNKKTDRLKDPKYFNLYADACGDKNFSNLKTDDERKAYTALIYNTDLTSKTAAEAKTIATGLINTFGAACPSGTCNTIKFQSIQNNPTTYTGNVLAKPDLYGGTSGTTYAAGLIDQIGTKEVITGTPPTFTACATATDCGTAASGTTFICINHFCQNSATAKAVGATCSYNGDCLSGNCGTAAQASTDKICLDSAATTGSAGGFSGGGTLVTLLSNGSSCLAGYQCASGNCDVASHTCKSGTDVAPIAGSIKLGGLYKRATGADSSILSASLNVTTLTSSTVSVSLSEGLYGHTDSATFNSSTNKISFTISVSDSGTQKTLTCTGVDVQSDGATLSGTDACTLGSSTKSISHTKQ